jgi:hypothetical protein
MSKYNKKNVHEPLLFDGGDDDEGAPAHDTPEDEFEEPDVLTRQQINQCMMDIEDIHPLQERVKLAHILPCFRMCFKPKPVFRDQLRIALLDELGLKLPKTEKRIAETPFLLLGFGINSYFDIME